MIPSPSTVGMILYPFSMALASSYIAYMAIDDRKLSEIIFFILLYLITLFGSFIRGWTMK